MVSRRRPRKKRSRKRFSRRIPIKPNNLVFVKQRGVYDVVNSNNNVLFLTYPDDDCTAGAEYTHLSELYDVYRLHAVQYKWIPRINTQDTPSATGYSPVYMCYDQDGSSPSTVADIVEYGNFKIKNLLRPFKYYYKVPKTTGTALAQPGFNGYFPTDSLTPYQGRMIFRSTNPVANVTDIIGTVLITYYMSFKARR